MNERTLEQALARAEIARQPGACHFYSVATYHDALVDLVLLADEVERLRSDGMTSALSVGEEMGKLHNEVKRLRATGVERMEAEVKALAFACNDTERTFKGRDAEISSAEDRVVDAAVAWRLVWRDSVIYQHEHRQKLIEAVDALIAAREKASESNPLPDG